MSAIAVTDKEVYLPGPDLATCSRMLALRSGLDALWHEYGAHCPDCTVFVSFTDMTRRATVLTASGQTPDQVWKDIICQLETSSIHTSHSLHIKLDLVTERYQITWQRLKETLSVTKRNYFRFGIALDGSFKRGFLEQELNANAMLYGSRDIESASLNESNFRRYVREKYGNEQGLDFADDGNIQIFVTQAFYSPSGESLLRIAGKGLESGHRLVDRIDVSLLDDMIKSASSYLCGQLSSEGRFKYGWYPCFDKEIPGYNTLRHASSTYAMTEAYEIFPDDNLLSSIRTSLHYLVRWHVRERCINQIDMAYLIDEGWEVKLGGNAVLLLALTKYSELSGDQTFVPLMEKVAAGIASFQRSPSGRFMHVLNYPTLLLKDDFRVIYYDGEAAFALAYYYRFCRQPRWLQVVESAFSWFEKKQYGKHHDHWIAYACEVMYEVTEDRRYYNMAVSNIAGYLDFVGQRITTFPTLLELMVSTERLFSKHEQSFSGTYDAIGKDEFKKAMVARAHKLLHGYFWPELAMYYRVPNKIQGTFFIRHHSFRVRIDDVEHYLSALIGYRRSLLRNSKNL